jgi:hypothetical protein
MISQTFAMAVENGPTEYDLGRAAPMMCTLPLAAAVATGHAFDPSCVEQGDGQHRRQATAPRDLATSRTQRTPRVI